MHFMNKKVIFLNGTDKPRNQEMMLMPVANTGQLLLHCHPSGYDFQQTYKPGNHMGLRAIKHYFNQKPVEDTKTFQLLQPPHQTPDH